MVDMSDSKSDSRERVGVQVPLPLPDATKQALNWAFFVFGQFLYLIRRMESRMHKVSLFVIFLLTPLLGNAGSAGAINAGDLADACKATVLSDVKSDKLLLMEGYCVGYLRSYIETYHLLNETEELDPAIGCIPPSVSPNDIAKALVDFVSLKPESKPLMPATVLYVALGQKFPC